MKSGSKMNPQVPNTNACTVGFPDSRRMVLNTCRHGASWELLRGTPSPRCLFPSSLHHPSPPPLCPRREQGGFPAKLRPPCRTERVQEHTPDHSGELVTGSGDQGDIFISSCLTETSPSRLVLSCGREGTACPAREVTWSLPCCQRGLSLQTPGNSSWRPQGLAGGDPRE